VAAKKAQSQETTYDYSDCCRLGIGLEKSTFFKRIRQMSKSVEAVQSWRLRGWPLEIK
jgi:hypothetical protein